MWSSSVSLKLMLLFHKELRMLLFNSDRSKPLQCRKASGKGLWKLPCFYHALRIDFFWLLDWEAVTVVTSWRVGLGRALENSHLSPKVCARTARIWKSVLFFLHLASFCSFSCSVLFRSQQLHDSCFWSVWKWSSDHCTVTAFQYVCVCVEREIRE